LKKKEISELPILYMTLKQLILIICFLEAIFQGIGEFSREKFTSMIKLLSNLTILEVLLSLTEVDGDIIYKIYYIKLFKVIILYN
jgi:hypothetical protein